MTEEVATLPLNTMCLTGELNGTLSLVYMVLKDQGIKPETFHNGNRCSTTGLSRGKLLAPSNLLSRGKAKTVALLTYPSINFNRITVKVQNKINGSCSDLFSKKLYH